MFNKNMMEKLQNMKQQADESKAKLELIEITEDAGGGLVSVTMNGNRKVVSIDIKGDHKTMEKEDLEDLFVVALDRALQKVNEINEQEVMASAQSLFSGM